MDDWSHQFNSLLSSPLGVELINQLNIRKGQLFDDAANAKSQDLAYALLNQAGGVKLVIEHLVPNLYSEAVGYFQYLVSQSTLAMPLDRPLPSDRVYKQLDPRPFVDWRSKPN
jgi:hypothetical protein